MWNNESVEMDAINKVCASTNKVNMTGEELFKIGQEAKKIEKMKEWVEGDLSGYDTPQNKIVREAVMSQMFDDDDLGDDCDYDSIPEEY